MSLYTYVDHPNTNLVCCICRTPFTEPTTTLTCTHTFCKDCILRALSHAPLCPIDRSSLSERDLVPSDPIIRTLVEELAVECVHKSSGCEHVCQRQLLAVHLRDECVYGQVECSEAECDMIVARCELEAHRKEKHGKDTKQESVEATEPDQQQPSCSTPTTDKPQQKEVELLMEQNFLLRHRVEMLEGAMQVMKREMNAVKSALGPWFRIPTTRPTCSARARTSLRPEGEEVAAEMTNGNTGPSLDAVNSLGAGEGNTVQARATHTRRRSLPLSGEMMENGGDGIREGDPFAGYFPTIGDFGGLLSHHGAFAQQQQQGGGPGGLQINPGAVTRVAPLDLGTTLTGTLEGLRESVVGVAAGIDSLGRRSEIALANESLRLGEEVVSMRGAVHGLRMQIHAMMMERNAQITGREEGMGVGSSWMGGGMNFGVQNASGPRMYSYGGPPPNITKL
ncbi:hypothetical protein Agabi119p4_2406 [Agaricus bisporus var. burnettii]|uniref:RING-type domain-containing protein n=1 Tax=Agaricus bisporus var. burnettii TaxID=192524 RepID=A0A8H7KKC1_AGABI|nr:hypothetical protein Agabi119p4_2406 [Agaricus bisporus var. burnettii]